MLRTPRRRDRSRRSTARRAYHSLRRAATVVAVETFRRRTHLLRRPIDRQRRTTISHRSTHRTTYHAATAYTTSAWHIPIRIRPSFRQDPHSIAGVSIRGQRPLPRLSLARSCRHRPDLRPGSVYPTARPEIAPSQFHRMKYTAAGLMRLLL